MKLLFICNQNKNRSPTAAAIFSKRYKTKSAGLYCEGNSQLTKELLEWADIVFVMEAEQRTEISKRFPKEYMKKKILCLGIPDIYNVHVKNSKSQLKDKLKHVVEKEIEAI